MVMTLYGNDTGKFLIYIMNNNYLGIQIYELMGQKPMSY